MKMTPEDQKIVDAIWGEDGLTKEDRQVVEGIMAMAELAVTRFNAGKCVIVPETDTLH
jgi:hypothetical protein